MGRGWENKGRQWCSYLMKAESKLFGHGPAKWKEQRGWGRVIGGQIKAKSNDTRI